MVLRRQNVVVACGGVRWLRHARAWCANENVLRLALVRSLVRCAFRSSRFSVARATSRHAHCVISPSFRSVRASTGRQQLTAASPRAPSCRRRPPSPRAAPPRVSLLVGLHVLSGKFIVQAGDSERGYPATVGKFSRSPASHAVRSMYRYNDSF